MSFLVNDMAEIMRDQFPDIYRASFESLEWFGDVNLTPLTTGQFRTVYELARAQYARFLDAGGKDRSPGAAYFWQEYISALESDPRLTQESDS